MLTLLKWFFITLGVIFFGLIVSGVYIVVADPFELRPLWDMLRGGVSSQVGATGERSAAKTSVSDGSGATTSEVSIQSTESEESVVEPETDSDAVHMTPPETTTFLSPAQVSALEMVGIDPSTLPSEISPEQEQCFIEAIGATRVEEIKAGAAPTPFEIFDGRGCL